MINFFDFWILDSLIYELYMQNQLNTDLSENLLNHIPELPPKWSADRKFQFFFQILLKNQQDFHLNQILTRIKQHPVIKRIENLFQNRETLLKDKK